MNFRLEYFVTDHVKQSVVHTAHMLTFVIMPMKVIPLRIPNQMPAEAEMHIQTINYTTQNALKQILQITVR